MEHRRHGGELLVGRHLVDGGLAHRGPAQGGVPDEEAGVDPQIPLEAAEEVAEREPIPRERAQRVARYPLDDGHHLDDVIGVVLSQRGDGEPAVAGDDRRHAVQRRRARRGIPHQLRVVVRVDVDDTGSDDQAVTVEGAARGLVGVADADDAAVADADVGAVAGPARAIDDLAIAQQKVQHECAPPRIRGGRLGAPGWHR